MNKFLIMALVVFSVMYSFQNIAMEKNINMEEINLPHDIKDAKNLVAEWLKKYASGKDNLKSLQQLKEYLHDPKTNDTLSSLLGSWRSTPPHWFKYDGKPRAYLYWYEAENNRCEDSQDKLKSKIESWIKSEKHPVTLDQIRDYLNKNNIDYDKDDLKRVLNNFAYNSDVDRKNDIIIVRNYNKSGRYFGARKSYENWSPELHQQEEPNTNTNCDKKPIKSKYDSLISKIKTWLEQQTQAMSKAQINNYLKENNVEYTDQGIRSALGYLERHQNDNNATIKVIKYASLRYYGTEQGHANKKEQQKLSRTKKRLKSEAKHNAPKPHQLDEKDKKRKRRKSDKEATKERIQLSSESPKKRTKTDDATPVTTILSEPEKTSSAINGSPSKGGRKKQILKEWENQSK